MTVDHFWDIIDRVHKQSGGDMEAKCELLDEQLCEMPMEGVKSFQNYFDDCMGRAYSWPLWAAAYIMGGGCSDDGFMDFRSTLISMGRATFEKALSDPETLADLDLEDGEEMQYEGYQYVAGNVLEDLGEEESKPAHPHPKEPSGQPWDETTVAQLVPRLAKRFDFQ